MNRLLTCFILLCMAVWGQPHAAAESVIACYGNTRTASYVLAHELQIADTGSQTLQLHQARLRLLRKRVIGNVDFFQNASGRPVAMVKEKAMFSMMPVWDFDRLFGFSGGVEFELFNTLGVWDRLRMMLQTGGLQKYRAVYALPWFFGHPDWTLRLEGLYYKNDYLYGDYPEAFMLKQQGLGASVIRSLGWWNQIGCGLNAEWIETDSETVMKGKVRQRLLRIHGCWEADTRDWPNYPGKGIYARIFIEPFFTETGNLFNRLKSEFRLFVPTAHRSTLAFQTELLLSDSHLPVYKRLHLGGDETLRGYLIGFKAGDNLWVSSLEWRLPMVYHSLPESGLHAGYTAVIFWDAGSAWYHDSSAFKHVYGALGLGIHAIWDTWVLRAEYGHIGKGWGFINAGVGAKF